MSYRRIEGLDGSGASPSGRYAEEGAGRKRAWEHSFVPAAAGMRPPARSGAPAAGHSLSGAPARDSRVANEMWNS